VAESWTVLVPIGNLVLADEGVNREFRVDRVTFVHRDRLPFVRRRLRLGVHVSELKKLKKSRRFERFFEAAEAYAVVTHSGSRKEAERRCLEIVREGLHLLSLSQLGYSPSRTLMKPLVPQGEVVHSYVDYLSVRSRAAKQDSAPLDGLKITAQKDDFLVIGAPWKHFQDTVFFTNLLKILRRETKVEAGWRDELRRAAVMKGEGVGTNDLLKSFLWNMVALEILLTENEERKMLETLPKRAEALLGWVFYWEQRDYWHRIGDVYMKRNALIHQGRSDLITDKDFGIYGSSAVNVLANLVNLPILNSKNAVIAFLERVEAERILGVKPKVRPKDMRFFTSRVTFEFPDTDVRFSISTDDFSVIPSDT
jgi:hypothetical protein